MSRRSAVRVRIWTLDLNMSWNYSFARMSEWSKEPDLRPGANSAWVRTPLRACLVCCLPTAERCLSVGGLYVGDFLLKFISSFLIYIFQILMSAVCRRLSVALWTIQSQCCFIFLIPYTLILLLSREISIKYPNKKHIYSIILSIVCRRL